MRPLAMLAAVGKHSQAMFAFHLVLASIYGFALVYHHRGASVDFTRNSIVPRPLQAYGLIQYFTYQCLWLQFISSTLHLLVSVAPLRPVRDFFFNSVAFPVGFIVCTHFWIVWLVAGRELIYPRAIDAYLPAYLNHICHSLPLSANLLTTLLVHHKPTLIRQHSHALGSPSLLASLVYPVFYGLLLLYLRIKTSFFVYIFLNKMNFAGVALYLLATVATGIGGHELCRRLTRAIH